MKEAPPSVQNRTVNNSVEKTGRNKSWKSWDGLVNKEELLQWTNIQIFRKELGNQIQMPEVKAYQSLY